MIRLEQLRDKKCGTYIYSFQPGINKSILFDSFYMSAVK